MGSDSELKLFIVWRCFVFDSKEKQGDKILSQNVEKDISDLLSMWGRQVQTSSSVCSVWRWTVDLTERNVCCTVWMNGTQRSCVRVWLLYTWNSRSKFECFLSNFWDIMKKTKYCFINFQRNKKSFLAPPTSEIQNGTKN